jgi:hypothetical protein
MSTQCLTCNAKTDLQMIQSPTGTFMPLRVCQANWLFHKAAVHFPNRAIAICCEFVNQHPASANGPARAILSDFNLEDRWFPEALDSVRTANIPADEKAATLAVLHRLLTIPEPERTAGLD